MGRLNKRQQRELAELEELEKARSASVQQLPKEDDVEQSASDEDEPALPTAAKAGFGAVSLAEYSYKEWMADPAAPTA